MKLRHVGFGTISLLLLSGCLTASTQPSGSHGSGGGGGAGGGGGNANPGDNSADADAIQYRDLATHPGCTTDGLAYPAAQIPGYKCAAKEYALGNVAEDKSKPIVLLIHGNSSTPGDWEVCVPGSGATAKCVDPSTSPPMLSERLVAAGFRAYAIDMRMDKTDDPTSNDPKTGNPAHNMDHGWGVPIVEHFVESVMGQFPDRKLAIVGFSYGPTTIRDALRRLHRDGNKPFEHISHLVYASGANHGVSSFDKKCGDPMNPTNVTMAGRVACEMGKLVGYTPTAFLTPLNGSGGAFETPCSDGDSAYGQSGVCGGNKVKYTTVVMRDISNGTFQDEFVSEGSSALQGADNLKNELTDQDQTGYFYAPAFKNHFGSIRSEAGLTKIMTALSQ